MSEQELDINRLCTCGHPVTRHVKGDPYQSGVGWHECVVESCKCKKFKVAIVSAGNCACGHAVGNHFGFEGYCTAPRCECKEFRQKGLSECREQVDHPRHYNMGKYEVIDVIEDWKLGFNLGNAVKYIARAEHKNGKEDIRKAIWYLRRYLGENKKEEKT